MRKTDRPVAQEHEDQVLTEIVAAEPIPAETHFLCASLDEVNVLLSEPGRKKGRPNEHPHEDASERVMPDLLREARWLAMTASTAKCPQETVAPASGQPLCGPHYRGYAPTLKAKFERSCRTRSR